MLSLFALQVYIIAMKEIKMLKLGNFVYVDENTVLYQYRPRFLENGQSSV